MADGDRDRARSENDGGQEPGLGEVMVVVEGAASQSVPYAPDAIRERVRGECRRGYESKSLHDDKEEICASFKGLKSDKKVRAEDRDLEC